MGDTRVYQLQNTTLALGQVEQNVDGHISQDKHLQLPIIEFKLHEVDFVVLTLTVLGVLLPLGHENEMPYLCWVDLAKLIQRVLLAVLRLYFFLVLDVQLKYLGV